MSHASHPFEEVETGWSLLTAAETINWPVWWWCANLIVSSNSNFMKSIK